MAGSSILARLLVAISGDTAGLQKSLASASKDLNGFANSTKAAQTQIGGLTAGFAKMASVVGTGFLAFQAVGVVQDAIKSIADFEHQMSTVKAITGATGKEFQALRKSALDLGASTRYTSQQVAELQTEYGRLGFTTEEILAATEATLDLATATGEGLAKSADVAGSTVRAFGLSADETRRVVDVMAESFNKSALGLENFSESMKYVAPIAAQSNISVEETTALLGTLADAGIRGSQAGTSLRKIMTDIGDESGTLSERLAKLAAKGLTGADAMSEVGRTAYASLLVLVNNTKKTEEMTEALNNAAGAGKRAADIMADDLTGDITLLTSAYDGLILAFSDGSGILRELVQSLTAVVNATTKLVNGSSEVGKFFKFLVDQITGPIKLLGQFAKGFVDAGKAVDDHGAKLRAIENTVQAAFDSGNIEAYIRALDQNIYREEIIAAIRKRQAEESAKAVQEQLKVLDAIKPQVGIITQLEERLKGYEEKRKAAFSVGDIEFFNQKIRETRDELELLNLAGSESGFLKNLNAGVPQSPTDPSQTANPLEGAFPTSLPVPDTAELKASLFDIENVKAQHDKNDQTRLEQEQARQAARVAMWQEGAQSASQYGDIIGSAFGDAAAGQITFAQAAKKATAEIVKTLLARAMAGIIASAATAGGPPPVAIALAAAGVAAIGALFAKFVGGSGVATGGSAGTPQSRASQVSRVSPLERPEDRIEFDAKFEIEGTKLVAVTNNTNKRSERTG